MQLLCNYANNSISVQDETYDHLPIKKSLCCLVKFCKVSVSGFPMISGGIGVN